MRKSSQETRITRLPCFAKRPPSIGTQRLNPGWYGPSGGMEAEETVPIDLPSSRGGGLWPGGLSADPSRRFHTLRRLGHRPFRAFVLAALPWRTLVFASSAVVLSCAPEFAEGTPSARSRSSASSYTVCFRIASRPSRRGPSPAGILLDKRLPRRYGDAGVTARIRSRNPPRNRFGSVTEG